MDDHSSITSAARAGAPGLNAIAATDAATKMVTLEIAGMCSSLRSKRQSVIGSC